VAPAAFYVLVFWVLLGIPPTEHGIRCKVLPNLRYWFRTAVLIGLVVLLFCALAIPVLAWAGFRIPLPKTSPTEFWGYWLTYACVDAPVAEEFIYRGVLCPALACLLGRWAAIFLSGSLFALLHVIGGNPGPDNFIAGYFLAWAFLKSGSLLVPIAMHSVGNLFAGLIHLLNYSHPNLLNGLL